MNWQQITPKKRGQAQMQAPSLGGRFVQDNVLKSQGTLTWLSWLSQEGVLQWINVYSVNDVEY